jgi:hypothetical protein
MLIQHSKRLRLLRLFALVLVVGISGLAVAHAAATGLSLPATPPAGNAIKPSGLPAILVWVIALVGSTLFWWAIGMLGAAALIAAAIHKMRTGSWPWPFNVLFRY